MTETRDVVEATTEGLLKEVVALTMDGWAISSTNPGEALPYGAGFSVTMERDGDTVEAFKEKAEAVQGKAKLTVQERMAKARASKAAKIDLSNIQ